MIASPKKPSAPAGRGQAILLTPNVLAAGCELFCRRCYAREVGLPTVSGCTVLRVSWV